MARLPDLSGLSLASSRDQGGETGALVDWNTDGTETRLLVSFHDAVALRMGGAFARSEPIAPATAPPGTPADTENDSDDDPADSIPLSKAQKILADRAEQLEREQGPISKRLRPRTLLNRDGDDVREPMASNRRLMAKEYDHVCWWLRLCLVPSQPDASTGAVELLDERDMPPLVLGAATLAVSEISRNAKDAPTAYMNARRMESASISARVSSVNGTPRILLEMPAFEQLTSGRSGLEDSYMQWLRTDQDCGYTEAPLPAPDDKTSFTTVEHVVAQNWLYPTQVLREFASADNDPVNVIWTLKSYNKSKGIKALHFGKLGKSEIKLNASYAPLGFVPELQSRMARKVAYMFLTYPLVSSDKYATHTRVGSPKYAEKFNTIRRLCTTNVSENEVQEAWVVYGLFGVVNPLVVSASTRMLLSDSTSWLSELLFVRMHGIDACSNAVIDSLRYFGVGFGDE